MSRSPTALPFPPGAGLPRGAAAALGVLGTGWIAERFGTSTPLRPSADAVATLEVVDAIRRRIGVTYPDESEPGVPA